MLILLSALILLAACPGSGESISAADGMISSVQLKGRVVDFESCIAKSGCQGVASVRVALFYNRQHSATTSNNGAFTLRAPDGVPLLLFASDSQGKYLPTLTASAVTTSGADVYGVEVYILLRNGGLYQGIQQDSTAQVKKQLGVESDALYLGQVYKIEGGAMKAIDYVSAHAFPAGTFSYVSCNPRFKECKGQKTLAGAKETTIFGQFLMHGTFGKGDYAVWATAKDFNFQPVMAPLAPGHITIGTHKGTKRN